MLLVFIHISELAFVFKPLELQTINCSSTDMDSILFQVNESFLPTKNVGINLTTEAVWYYNIAFTILKIETLRGGEACFVLIWDVLVFNFSLTLIW